MVGGFGLPPPSGAEYHSFFDERLLPEVLPEGLILVPESGPGRGRSRGLQPRAAVQSTALIAGAHRAGAAPSGSHLSSFCNRLLDHGFRECPFTWILYY
jgi:hypothetical protein